MSTTPPAADADAAVTRAELELAVRRAHLAIETLHDDLLRLAAQVVALTEALATRDAADAPTTPTPPPTTPLAPAPLDLESAVDIAVPALLRKIRFADETTPLRLELEPPVDKYAVAAAGPPCQELLPLCGARCCRMPFALTSQDLDEGVVRWDYARPYVIRHRPDGQCTHHHAPSGGCTIHPQRPAVCRAYDCREDRRVWLDYARRIPAPMEALFEIRVGGGLRGVTAEEAADPDAVAERVLARRLAIDGETAALRNAHTSYDER